MSGNVEIQDFEYIKERLRTDNNWTKATVWQGILSNPNERAFQTFVFNKGAQLDDQLAFFERHHRGDYTMRLDTRGAVIFFFNGPQNQYPMQGSRINVNSEEVQSTMMNLRLENERLKGKIAMLEKELEEFRDNGSKFGYAIAEAAKFIFPGLHQAANEFNPQTNMQGMEQTQYTEQALEEAFGILLQNFGEDWLIRFAQQVQQNPAIVSQIKVYFK